ncbi:MAG: hypothetical protein IPO21_17830 [Bacteroidales bacterium]|nr:hypothetical protein [Bacteroidales bacterium]
MENQNQYLESLTEIRSIMERSSKFLSLSGLSGIAAGLTALVAGLIASFYLDSDWNYHNYMESGFGYKRAIATDKLLFFFALGAVTLFTALLFAFFFTLRNAKKKNLPIWDKAAKLMLFHMSVPLAVGGFFVIVQVFHYEIIGLVAPSMLIFYGLALLNASKYTVSDIKWLALAEIALGLIALIFFGYGLYFWILGFGILHIIYGSVIYFKYDRKSITITNNK